MTLGTGSTDTLPQLFAAVFKDGQEVVLFFCAEHLDARLAEVGNALEDGAAPCWFISDGTIDQALEKLKYIWYFPYLFISLQRKLVSNDDYGNNTNFYSRGMDRA